MPFADIQDEKDFMDFTQQSSFTFTILNSRIKLTVKPLDEQVKQIHISVKIYSIPSSSLGFESKTEQRQAHFALKEEPSVNSDQKQDQFRESIEYSDVFQIWDLINYKKQKQKLPKQQQSLLWLKLYLQEFFKKLSLLLRSQNYSQDQKNKIFYETFHFTHKLHIRKCIQNQKSVSEIIQSIKTQNSQGENQQSNPSNHLPQSNLQTQSNHYIQRCLQNKQFLLVKIDPNQITCSNTLFQSSLFINLPKKCIPTQKICSRINIQFNLKQKKDKIIQNIFFDQRPSF